MGAGTYPAGSGPAGYSPVSTPAASRSTAPVAWYYDPETRTFVFDTDGNALAVHPVDQAVAIACTVAAKRVPWAPDDGIDFETIKATRRNALQNAVTKATEEALGDLITGGDVVFFGAPIVVQEPGRMVWVVEYQNLRLPKGTSRSSLRISP